MERPFQSIEEQPECFAFEAYLEALEALEAETTSGQVPVPTVVEAPRFTSCSQCGAEFGPGDSGYSHCSTHRREQRLPRTR